MFSIVRFVRNKIRVSFVTKIELKTKKDQFAAARITSNC